MFSASLQSSARRDKLRQQVLAMQNNATQSFNTTHHFLALPFMNTCCFHRYIYFPSLKLIPSTSPSHTTQANSESQNSSSKSPKTTTIPPSVSSKFSLVALHDMKNQPPYSPRRNVARIFKNLIWSFSKEVLDSVVQLLRPRRLRLRSLIKDTSSYFLIKEERV